MIKQSNTATTETTDAPARPKHLSIDGRRIRPREARDHLRMSFARASRAGRELADLSQNDLAAELEVAKPFIGHSELGEPNRPVPSVLHITSAKHSPKGRIWAGEVARWIVAELGMRALQAVAVKHADRHAERLSSVLREAGDPARELATALADGELSDAELVAIEREAREGQEALAELEAWAAAKLRERRGGT